MSLVTYEKSAVGDMWKGLVHLDPKVWRPFEPGDWVIHRHYDGHGMVVAVDDVEICVLWSVEPEVTFQRKLSGEISDEIDADIMKDLLAMAAAELPK